MTDMDWIGSAVAWLGGSILILVGLGAIIYVVRFLNYLNRLDAADYEELYDMAQAGTLPKDYDETK